MLTLDKNIKRAKDYVTNKTKIKAPDDKYPGTSNIQILLDDNDELDDILKYSNPNEEVI